MHTYLLDGDNVRHGLNRNLGFSAADRSENIRRIGEVAKLLADAGLVTLPPHCSHRADRDSVRALLAPGEFIEISAQRTWRPAKHAIRKGFIARPAGEIRDFTGLDAPYEAPLQPELVLDTEARSPAELAAAVVDYLEARGIVPAVKAPASRDS